MRRFALLVLVACSKSEVAADAGPPPITSASAVVASPAPSASDAAPEPPSLLGTWERQTEPYRGMQIKFEPTRLFDGIVTTPPPPSAERISADAGTKAQLECQAKLWKVGETVIDMRPPAKALAAGAWSTGDHPRNATILVRDWGLTGGVCRHADSRAPAELSLSDDGKELVIKVTRGKTVATQAWSRVSE